MAEEEKACCQHFLRWLTKRGKKPLKTRGKKTLPRHLPCCCTTSCSLRAGRGPAGSWSRARGVRAPGGRALTSVSPPGAARSASSELRAAVPGHGRRRAGCIAAAASGQHPGALHVEGRVGSGSRSPRCSHGSGERAWTAPPGAGRSVRPARLESVLRLGCEHGRRTPSPAGCYLIPGRPGALPTPRRSAPPRASLPAPAAPAPSPLAAVPKEAVAAARPREGGERRMEGEVAAGV